MTVCRHMEMEMEVEWTLMKIPMAAFHLWIPDLASLQDHFLHFISFYRTPHCIDTPHYKPSTPRRIYILQLTVIYVFRRA